VSAGTKDGARSGQVLAGKYRVERLLGRGGMGDVYEARHVVVGRRFAIKFLRSGVARGRDSSARFLREAQAAGALDNEHIAAVVDFDVAPDDAPFLVMEYLKGESLAATLLREGALPAARVVGILLQVCDGLTAAHAAGIVHRDLKPDNLFLVERADGRELVKIVDFGVAKLVGSELDATVTQSGAVLGTPLYMAPEQARGEKSVDFRVDIHALGVIAYEALSGERPHPGESYNAILAHILTRPVRPLRELCPELPDALIRTVERALSFEPGARHDSAAALARELRPFADRTESAGGTQVDLRRPAHVDPSAATVDALADTGTPEGTLQSAVGDARSASSSGKRRSSLWPTGALLVALGALWLLARARPASPSAAAPDQATTASLSSPVTPPSSTVAGAASVSVSALPAAGASVRSAPAEPSKPKKPAKAAPSGQRERAPDSRRKVSFDEQNPY
jgi:eukaryotic-like serine/threonine-protein kinase